MSESPLSELSAHSNTRQLKIRFKLLGRNLTLANMPHFVLTVIHSLLA
ncbi:hypothetical protein HAL013_06840 [Helicobacter ailurogastricus]|uniref:Uncharacterized protein n=1 Tax=Helicobacter ailurogastricus TaxID=1578720 RepID=A0A0K2X8V0_9HELI|nr:hypothetical protein HAL011_07050 [Helicobacter ailurogastricus]CRF42496.1 hypothetical protein HAL013_06840 [Helicobacter ailurogastricus]CRF44197.1 hypothetical protein HAL09_07700 [Helicobacter ailurogastricus]